MLANREDSALLPPQLPIVLPYIKFTSYSLVIALEVRILF